MPIDADAHMQAVVWFLGGHQGMSWQSFPREPQRIPLRLTIPLIPQFAPQYEQRPRLQRQHARENFCAVSPAQVTTARTQCPNLVNQINV